MRRNGCFSQIWFWCGLLLIGMLPARMNAQAWKNDVLIEGRDPAVSQNVMDWDENGNLHLILTGDNLYHLWFDGQVWQEDKSWSNDESSSYAWIAIERENLIHVLTRYKTSVIYKKITSSGWSKGIAIAYADNDDSNINPLKVDSHGNPHTVYTRYDGYIMHTVYHEDTWTHHTAGLADDGYYGTGFELDADDNVHLCFVNQGDFKYRKFNGIAWQEETILTGLPQKIMMKLDAQGVPHIVYIVSDVTGDYLGYSTKADDSWINEIIAPCTTQGSLVLDHNSAPHVLCNSDGLKHFYRDGRQWAEDVIDSDVTYQPYVSAGFDPTGILTVCAVNTVGKSVILFRLIEEAWEGEKILEGGSIGELASAIDRHDVIHGLVMNSHEDRLEYGTIQGNRWISETLVSDMTLDAKYLSIGVDGNDKVHCCYIDPGLAQVIHAHKTQSGWEYEVVTGDLAFRSCQMAVSNNGDIAILGSSLGELLLFRKVNGTWSVTSLGIGEHGAIDVCMDSNNTPHCVFSRPEQTENYNYHALYYLFFEDGDWKEELIHSKNVGDGLERTILVLDSSDSPRVMQNSTLQGTHYKYDSHSYSVRDDQGWHNEIYTSMSVGSISLGRNIDDRSLKLYNYYDRIECAIESETGEWTYSFVCETSEKYAKCNTIMADSTGRFHIVHNYNNALNYAYLPLPVSGVRLDMPSSSFSQYKPCYLNAYLRHDESPLLNAPFCLLLEYQQNYWFWPDWRSTFCTVPVDVWAPGNIVTIIPRFMWPYFSNPGSVEGLVFWAALLNEDMTEIIGGADGLGRWEFSYY